MSTFAFPNKFQLTFDPTPEGPSVLREVLMLLVGVVLGATLATAFPLFR